MTNFVSVGTAAARFQDISLNPQKLAGQCAKLKCCLNFEVDSYVESIKKMPSKEIRLETADATYYHFKYDVFKREITYSTDKNIAANLVTIDAKRAFEVIQLNKNGEKPLNLKREEEIKEADKKQYNDILGQDITRVSTKRRSPRKNRSDHGAAVVERCIQLSEAARSQAITKNLPRRRPESRGNRKPKSRKARTAAERTETAESGTVMAEAPSAPRRHPRQHQSRGRTQCQ